MEAAAAGLLLTRQGAAGLVDLGEGNAMWFDWRMCAWPCKGLGTGIQGA
jgi:hypothetical protein